MATRKLGKYKTTKREEALTMMDGGTIAGNLVCNGSVTATSAAKVTLSGNINSKMPVQTLTANTSILAADSGTVYFVNPAAETTLLLPTPANGLYYKFIATSTSSNDIIITTTSNGAAAANIGFGLHDVGGATVSAASAVDLITLGASSTNHTIGDWVECYCDGTNWYFQGSAVVGSSLTHA